VSDLHQEPTLNPLGDEATRARLIAMRERITNERAAKALPATIALPERETQLQAIVSAGDGNPATPPDVIRGGMP